MTKKSCTYLNRHKTYNNNKSNKKKMNPQFFKIQDVITNEYSVGKVLGKGAMATVFSCKRKNQEQPEEERALKVVDYSKWTGEELISRRDLIQCEIAALEGVAKRGAGSNQTNLLKVFGVIEEPSRVGIVMEYLKGKELFDRIVEKHRFTELDAIQVMKQILTGLDVLHNTCHVLHRDIKPENLVYLNPNNDAELKITDFGLAIFLNEQTKLPIVETTRITGTAPYLAPEIITNKTYSPASDVWSVGCLLYILLCGFAPFHGVNTVELFVNIKKGHVSFEGGNWMDVSADAKDLVCKLLEVDPKKRYGIANILKHPWMVNKNNKEQLSKKTMDRIQLFTAKRKLRAAVKALVVATSFSHFRQNELIKIIQEKQSAEHVSDWKRKNTGLTISQLEKMHMEFKKIENESHRIDFQGFQTVLRNLKLDVHLPLEKVFRLFDEGGDGLSYRSFLLDLVLLTEEDGWLVYAFKVFDTNKDGKLNKQEVESLLITILGGGNEKVRKHEFEEILSSIETDENGMIDLLDLKAGINRNEMLARNVKARRLSHEF